MNGGARTAVDAAPRTATRALRDLRLVPAAIAAWLAAGLLVGAPGLAAPTAAAASSAAVVAVAVALLLRRAATRSRASAGRLAAAALVLGTIAVVAGTVGATADVRAPPGLPTTNATLEAELVVTQEAAAGEDRLRGTATTIGDARGSMPVLVLGVSLAEPVGIGETVRVRGSVVAVPPGESVVAIVMAPRTDATGLDTPGGGAGAETIERVAASPGWLAWGNAMRAGFRDLAGGLPGDGGRLLTGLAIGDDRGLPGSLEAAMRASSLTHLTAVSWANCAIVVGGVMVGGAMLGIRRRWRISAALVVLAAFVVLVTPQPSVVRAAVMAAVALGGLALSRPARGLPLLAVAVTGILIADPWAAREYGFVLSVLATAGLLVLSGPLGQALARIMPRPLAVAIAIPLAAQLACQPALALLDDSLSAYGVVANLLAVPAAPLATVAGLAACLLAPILPGPASAAAWVGWLPSSWIGGVAVTIETLPGARLPWPESIAGLVLHGMVLLAVSVTVLGRGRSRLIAATALLGAVAGYSAIAVTMQLIGAASRPAHWQIAMCDVGQGDAVVVRSAGAVAVVDTGPDPDPLEACLHDLGVGRIDLLVLTHFDQDHAGGTAALVGRVGRVLVGPGDETSADRFIAPLEAAGADVVEVRRGDAGRLGAHDWRVLWPPGGGALAPGNDASVVVRFGPSSESAPSSSSTSAAPSTPRPEEGCPVGGCLTTVLLGDLGEGAQQRLLGAGPIGRAQVVKVSHHGSADQSSRLYGRLAARIALVGVGSDNGYGHPTGRALEMLGDTGAEIGRTDTDGLLLVAAEPDGRITLWRER